MSNAESTPRVEYRPIPGFIGYEVGSDGTVWTLWRRGPQYRKWSVGETRKQMRTNLANGYLEIQLRLGSGYKHKRIHRLVLEAFVGPCPDGCIAAHNNGNEFDNRLCNLRWTTQKENLLDRLDHGTMPFAHITPQDVEKMKQLRASGLSYASIGRRLGFSGGTVRNHILDGRIATRSGYRRSSSYPEWK